MTTNEEQRLIEAILILSDRTRDGEKGWAMLCGLAGAVVSRMKPRRNLATDR